MPSTFASSIALRASPRSLRGVRWAATTSRKPSIHCDISRQSGTSSTGGMPRNPQPYGPPAVVRLERIGRQEAGEVLFHFGDGSRLSTVAPGAALRRVGDERLPPRIARGPPLQLQVLAHGHGTGVGSHAWVTVGPWPSEGR